jgi:hypothetical protein
MRAFWHRAQGLTHPLHFPCACLPASSGGLKQTAPLRPVSTLCLWASDGGTSAACAQRHERCPDAHRRAHSHALRARREVFILEDLKDANIVQFLGACFEEGSTMLVTGAPVMVWLPSTGVRAASGARGSAVRTAGSYGRERRVTCNSLTVLTQASAERGKRCAQALGLGAVHTALLQQ